MSEKKLMRTVYHEITKFLPNKVCAYLDFLRCYKKILNLKEPKYFQEKMQWVKLNANLEEYTTFVDKYAVREYIEKTIGKKYLVKIYGVYDKFDEIDFDKLPEKFVLKATHGSGYNVICKDKSKLDLKDTKKKFDKWIKEDYYKIKGEMQYKNVPHKIICEEYLEDESGSLRDYKLYCFNGRLKFTLVISDRFDNITTCFYDRDWKKLELKTVYGNNKQGIQRPYNYTELVQLSEKLAKDFPHVRVDFYIVNNKIYFGELTFTAGGGCDSFYPMEKDLEIASWIDLNKYPKKIKKKTGIKDKVLIKSDKIYIGFNKLITSITYALKEKTKFRRF